MRTFALGGALACVAAPATAQFLPPDQSIVQFTRYQSVRERVIPGYEVRGLPVGSFTLLPTVELSGQYNDNVFALQKADATPLARTGRDDGFGRLDGSALLTSDWSGRSLSLNASGSIDRYATLTSENKTSVNLSAYGTQDLGSRTRIRLYGRYLADRESRESQNVFVLTRRPIPFQTASGAVGITQQFNKLQLQGEFGYANFHFDNGELPAGGVLDQRYRDADQYRGRGRVEFAQTNALAYFGQVTYDKVDYQQRTALNLDRNSTYLEALGGVRFELPVLARGEVGFGYLKADYRDQSLRSFSGLAIRSRVEFFPTQLMTVTLYGERSVNDAGLPNSSAYIALSGGGQVDYELLRQLILSANVRYENDSFNGLNREDNRYDLGASAEYRMNRHWSVRATYDYLDLSSTGRDRYKSFARNRFLVGLRYRI